MARQSGDPKTCNRCGRSGSHAFRRTPDGLYECTTATACRARARRSAGARADGRGRLPKQRGVSIAGPGVAYVIGPLSPERDIIEATLRESTELAVASGQPTKATLSALGSRNVRLIVMADACLDSIGFRNELGLRLRQPRLSSVPLFVYGRTNGAAHAGWGPAAMALDYRQPTDVAVALKRHLDALEVRAQLANAAHA